MTARAMVVDDERLICESVARALEGDGLRVERAGTGRGALELFARAPHDVVVLDLRLPDLDGLEVLARIRASDPTVAVVVITAHGTIELAVEAMRRGAYDFVKKPFDLDEVTAATQNALRARVLQRRLAYHDDRARRQHDEQVVRGTSPAMSTLWREVEVVAAQPVPLVLVTGETGTGKSLVARALHYGSERSGGPFVELNVAALPDTLVESELFGYERGAHSEAHAAKAGLAEVAAGGTLFLDEIGDLTPSAQAKLLSFLESRAFRRLGSTELRSVDVRIVAATNQLLSRRVEDKKLRADLYYRLAGLSLAVPALRERTEDIAALAHSFVVQDAQRFRRRHRAVSPEALAALTAWPWPGNVRELKATLQRAVLMSDADVLELGHLPSELRAGAAMGATMGEMPTLEEVELRYIRQVYAQCGGNKVRAAERLGITRQTLSRRLGEGE
jgi:two-component system response regulator AtoC